MNFKDKYIDINNTRSDVADNIFDKLTSNKKFVESLERIYKYDVRTFEHSIRVFGLAVAIGVLSWYDIESLTDLGSAALLHDLGKVDIDLAILNKKGPLSELEYNEMKNHVKYGCNYLKQNGFDLRVISIVGEHHERVDGCGYPNGLVGDYISKLGRILAVSDVFDALTSERPYNNAMDYQTAIRLIKDINGFGDRILEFLSIIKLGYIVEG